MKTVLVGMAPTDDEIAAVEKDPAALRGLIDAWTKLPQYDEKMRAFFANAFQQSQITPTDFSDQLPQQGDGRVAGEVCLDGFWKVDCQGSECSPT